MRMTVLVAPKVGVVLNSGGDTHTNIVRLTDRKANGEAFPGERVVRLPRRLTPRIWRTMGAWSR